MSSNIAIDEGTGVPEHVQFSDDGQFISVLSKEKFLFSYSAKSPTLCAVWNNRVVCLKGLSEISAFNFSQIPAEMKSIPVDREPTIIAIGPSFAAIGLENNVKYYEMTPPLKIKIDQLQYQYPDDGKLPPLGFTGKEIEKKYKNNVTNIEMNENFVKVALDNNTVLLHPLSDNYLAGDGVPMVFPEESYLPKISASILTNSFFIYATIDGKLYIFDLEELQQIQEHEHGVKNFSVLLIY